MKQARIKCPHCGGDVTVRMKEEEQPSLIERARKRVREIIELHTK